MGLFDKASSQSLSKAIFGRDMDHEDNNGTKSDKGNALFRKKVGHSSNSKTDQKNGSRKRSREESAGGEGTAELPAAKRHVKETLEEILARREKQARVPLVDLIVEKAPYPAICDDDSKGKKTDGTIDSVPPDVQVQEIAELVLEHGFCVIENVLPTSQMKELHQTAQQIEKDILQALNKKASVWDPQTHKFDYFRYSDVASRCRGRMDSRYKTGLPPFNHDGVVQNDNLLPVVQQLLGPSADLVYAGLIFSFPGSEDQPWHQDGEPLFPEISLTGTNSLPPYAINIFLPLSDEDGAIEAGPTEFIPGSHLLAEEEVMGMVDEYENKMNDKDEKGSSAKHEENKEAAAKVVDEVIQVASPVLHRGDALIYDYRVCHRGTANMTHRVQNSDSKSSGRVRRILYLMYARNWFKEHLNFGTEPLFPK